MLPTLFRIGGFAVPTHEFFIGLGLLTAGLVFVYEARRRRQWDDELVWVVLGALIGAGIFSQVGTGIRYLTEVPDSSLEGLFVHACRSVLGGLIGAYAGAVSPSGWSATGRRPAISSHLPWLSGWPWDGSAASSRSKSAPPRTCRGG